MKPAPFEYHTPTEAEEAVQLLRQLGDEAKVIAGGQSLVPMMALRLASFGHLVDLRRVDSLYGMSRDDGSLTIRAMTTQATVELDAGAMAAVPLLAEALPLIGHFQVRNRGTIGGSIAHADSASELPAVALALDAELDVIGPDGARTIPATEFFEGTWTTALADDEILAAVRFPIWEGSSGFAIEEIARRHGDFAIAGAVVALDGGGDEVRRAAVSLFGMGPTPLRATAAEDAIRSGASPEDVADAAVASLDPPADIHASSAYRRHVCATMVERALRRAKEMARG